MNHEPVVGSALPGRGTYPQVIRALIAARKSKTITLTFREATAIDLAGRDVLEAVQTSVYPKVIDCPPRASARQSLDAVAKDGIQLKVKVRVTVRANLHQLIGVQARKQLSLESAKACECHWFGERIIKVVLENPDVISKAVLAKRLECADGV